MLKTVLPNAQEVIQAAPGQWAPAVVVLGTGARPTSCLTSSHLTSLNWQENQMTLQNGLTVGQGHIGSALIFKLQMLIFY